jgi:Lipocalin-like domain
MRALILATLFSFVMFSCQNDESTSSRSSDLLLGIWEASEYTVVNEEYFTTYLRVDATNEKNCIIFEENNVFKSYDHGWCGTPPLSFYTTDGKYNQDGSKITFDIEHYAFSNLTMEITELDENKLVVKTNW